MKRKFIKTVDMIGLNLCANELLLLVLSFIQWNPNFNCVHSSWKRNSHKYISNLLSRPQNFMIFPNLEVLEVHFVETWTLENLHLKDCKNIKQLNLVSNELFYIDVALSNLPKLTNIKAMNMKFSQCRAVNCENLLNLNFHSVKIDAFLIPTITSATLNKCEFNKQFELPLLRYCETDSFYFLTKCSILKMSRFYSNSFECEELHTSEDIFFQRNYVNTNIKKLTVESYPISWNNVFLISHLITLFPNVKKIILIGFDRNYVVIDIDSLVPIIYKNRF